jgi:hypothetical protein
MGESVNETHAKGALLCASAALGENGIWIPLLNGGSLRDGNE